MNPEALLKDNKGNDQQQLLIITKEGLDYHTNSPCQHIKKFIEKCMENIHTDIRE